MAEKQFEFEKLKELHHNDINLIGLCSLVTALKRKKTTMNLSHEERCNGIAEELDELRRATNEPSEHIPPYTQRQEELADIILAALTELGMTTFVYNKDKGKPVDLWSDIIQAKIKYNVSRKD